MPPLKTPEKATARRIDQVERVRHRREFIRLTETKEEAAKRRGRESDRKKKSYILKKIREAADGFQVIRGRQVLIDLTAPDNVVARRAREATKKRRYRLAQLITETAEEAAARRAKDRVRCRKYRNKKRNKMHPKCEDLDLHVKDKSVEPLLRFLKTDSNEDVFADVDPEEIAEYKKLFPNLEDIVEWRVHCTSCNWHIGTAPINETMIKMHPVLRVIQCRKCYTFYTSGEFECDDDGSEYYCRWCGQGGEVYCCAKCPKVYCRRCLGQNLSRATVLDIENNEKWICFVCDPAGIVQLRADYWALLNFIEKQKEDLSNKSLTELELYGAMSKDRSICCPKITNPINLKRKFSISKNSTKSFKRADIAITRTETPIIINDALRKLEEIKIPINSEEISFQPDIRNTITCNDADSPSNPTIIKTISPLKEQLKLVSVEGTSNPLQSISQTMRQNLLLDSHTENSTDKSAFHTINGFCIDLHKASQQGYYRLPNGKLIQVKKLSTSYNMPTNLKDGKVPVVEDSPLSNTQITLTESIPIIGPTMNSPIMNTPILINPAMSSLTMNTPMLLPPTMNSSAMNPSMSNTLIVNSSSKIPPTIIYPKLTPLNSIPSTTISPLLNKCPPPLVFSSPFRSVPPRVLLKPPLTERCTPELTKIRSIRPTSILQSRLMNQIQPNLKVTEPFHTQSTVPVLVQLNNISDVPELHQFQPPKNQIRITSVSTVPAITQIQRNSNIPESVHSKSLNSDIRITSASTVPVITKITRNAKTPKPNQSSQPPDNEICITSVYTGQVNSSFDEAKANFEIRVQNSKEVCEHILGKMKLLTDSTAFKNIKTVPDVRDLIMHLSYLLTYAGSRFKSLQEKCVEDMKVIGFDSEDLNSNDDEIEILEPNLPLIDLDSDENDTSDSQSDIRKAVDDFELVDKIEVHNDQLMTNNVTPLEIVVNPTLNRDYTNKDVIHSTVITKESCLSSISKVITKFEYGNKPNQIKNIDLTEEAQTSKDVGCDEFLIDETTINQYTETERLQDEITNFSSETNSDITINEGDILAKYSENMTKKLFTNTSCPLLLPEEKFRSIFRLSKESFKFLLDKVQLKLNMGKNKSYIPPILKLAATINYLAKGNLQLSNDKDFSFKMSGATASFVVAETLNVLDSMSSVLIHFNQSKEDKRKCRKYYYLTTGFPCVIGCIDGTHINIIRPNRNDFLFRNKKGNYSLNIMITCDYKLLINSVVANRGGYSDNSSVWSISRYRRYFVQEYKADHKNSLLIGDSGYPLEPWLMTPYKLALPGSKEAKFNEAHSKCKASIKRCFGILKGRFRCLLNDKPLLDKPKKAAQIINVACILHNICVNHNVEFDETLFVTDEDDFEYNVKTYTSENLLLEAEEIRDGIKNTL